MYVFTHLGVRVFLACASTGVSFLCGVRARAMSYISTVCIQELSSLSDRRYL